MKKFYMILAALLIGSVCFAQKLTLGTLEKCEKQMVSQRATGYYGNSAFTSYFNMKAGQAIIMRADQFSGANTVGDTIKKIKFDAEDHTSNGVAYNGTSFTLKIYTGAADNAALATAFGTEGETEDLSILGTCVYTEQVTATVLGTSSSLGTNEIEITPWVITNANYWVVFISNGNNCILTQNNTISDTITYEQYQQDELPTITSNPEMKYLGWYPAGTYQGEPYNEYISSIMGLTAINSQYDIVITENVPFFQIYVQGAGEFVPNSDVAAVFADANPPTGLAPTSMTLDLNDNLVLYPFVMNMGPDATDGTITASITIDDEVIASLPITQSVPSQNGIALTQQGQNSFTIPAANLPTTNFNVCLVVEYSGAGDNANNNTTCIAVTRPTTVEENVAEAVSVYPNPANDMFTVANAEGATIVVVNSLGQVVTTIENAASNQTIDVSSFANGTYFVKVNEEVVRINVVK